MGGALSAGEFFDAYAHDFDAIYGGGKGPAGRLLDRIFRRSMLLRYRCTIEGCKQIEGASVLDVGCGPGHYSVALARRGAARVVGIDLSSGMLDIARRRAEGAGVANRCTFLAEDLLCCTLRERFDYCIVMGVMDYVARPEPFLAHVLSLCQGTAFLSFPAAGGLLAAMRRLRYRTRTPLYLYTPQRIEQICATQSLRRVQLTRLARDYFLSAEPASGDTLLAPC